MGVLKSMEGLFLVCMLGAADLLLFFCISGVYTGWRLRRVAPLALRMSDAVLHAWRSMPACFCLHRVGLYVVFNLFY